MGNNQPAAFAFQRIAVFPPLVFNAARLIAARAAARFGMQNIVYGFADKGNVFQVNAAFRFIQQKQVGVLRHQLQKLAAF